MALTPAGMESSAEHKVKLLSIDDHRAPRAVEELARIAALSYVDSVLALPDLHMKDQMEIPSSIATTTRDVLVPEFTSVAVNDGMGIVATTLRREEITPGRVYQFFHRINSHSAAHRFDMNRYSLSTEELERTLHEGARAMLGKYGLREHILGKMEGGGCVPVPDAGRAGLAEVVPLSLLRSRLSRAEMGLNFGGNHFLEVQVVDRIFERQVAARWGLEEGQVVVMYHLGPGSFSGVLLHHYSRRTKLRRLRVPLFFLSKLLFHFVQRRRDGAPLRKWALHFRRNRWTPFGAASPEGLLLQRAIAMAANFGFAYRLATIRAIEDSLHEALSPQIGAELLCDIPHNSLSEERRPGGCVWVARHNCCRLIPGAPTIVAGSSDVPSYLGIGGVPADDRLHSYDHGGGSIIERNRSAGRLPRGKGSVLRFVMTRGRNAKLVSCEEAYGNSSEPVDRLMACLEEHGLMRSVARLRPIGNLKN
jgi:RNA-splicing ligase RtcB